MADQIIPEGVGTNQVPSIPEAAAEPSPFSLLGQAQAVMSPEAQAAPQSDILSQALAINEVPSNYEEFANNLIQIRDQPLGTGVLASVVNTLKTSDIKGRYKKAYDYMLANPGPKMAGEEMQKAVDEGDALGATKALLSGASSIFTGYANLVLGRSEKEAKEASLGLAAQNMIGNIKDPKDAAQALELGDFYQQKLQNGESIVPEDQKPQVMLKTTGGENYAPIVFHEGMNLAEAQNYLNQLKEEKTKAAGLGALRVFLEKGADALPFVTAGNIYIPNESDKDQVGRRAALVNEINSTIQNDYYKSAMGGSIAGSLAGFIGAGELATEALGTEVAAGAGGANELLVGAKTLKIPNALSRWGTYGLYGGGVSAEDQRNLQWDQRLADTAEQILSLGVSEEIGQAAEHPINHVFASQMAANALKVVSPKLIPIAKTAGFVAGSTVGEALSNQVQRLMEGENPLPGLGEDLVSSLGVALGMGVVSGIGGMRAPDAQVQEVMNTAKDMLRSSYQSTINTIKTDSRYTYRQRDTQLKAFRNSLPTEETKALFDALNIRSSLNPATAPQTTKVADEAVNNAVGPALVTSLQTQVKKNQEAKNPTVTKAVETVPAVVTIPTPAIPPVESQEFRNLVENNVNTLINSLRISKSEGAEGVDVDLSPVNKRVIDYLEESGRIVGEETEDGQYYTVTGIKDQSGKSHGTMEAGDAFATKKEAIDALIEDSNLSNDDKEEVRSRLWTATTASEIDDIGSEVAPKGVVADTEANVAKKAQNPELQAAAEINIQKTNKEIQDLKRKTLEVPTSKLVETQDALAQAEAKKVELEGIRQTTYDEAVNKKLNEVEAQRKTGKPTYIPESILKRPEPNLPILIEGQPLYNRLQDSKSKQDDFKENNPQGLADVFGKNGKLTASQINWLKGLGAITEDNVPVMSAVEVANKEINKLAGSVERNPRYDNFKNYNFVQKIVDASISKFLLNLREGKKGASIDPETIFYAHLNDLIDQIEARRKRNVDLGSHLTIDKPGSAYAVAGVLETGKLSEAEELLAEQGPTKADKADEDLAVQAVQLAIPEFEKLLKTPYDKAVFELVKTQADKKTIEKEAKNLKVKYTALAKSVEHMQSEFAEALSEKIDNMMTARRLQAVNGELDASVSKPSDAITTQLKKQVFGEFTRLDKNDLLLPEERTKISQMINDLQSEWSEPTFEKLKGYLDLIERSRLGFRTDGKNKDVLKVMRDDVQGNLDNASIPTGRKKELSLSAESQEYYNKKLDEADEKYNQSQKAKEERKKMDGAIAYRSELSRLNALLMGEINRAPTKTGDYKGLTGKRVATDLTSESGKRDAAEQALARAVEKRARKLADGKGIRQIPNDPTGIATTLEPNGSELGKSANPEVFGEPVPKEIRITATQVGVDYGAKTYKQLLGKEAGKALNKQQLHEVAGSMWALTNLPEASKIIAYGPGLGKTRIQLGISQLHVLDNWKIAYVTQKGAINPDYKNGKIFGSLGRDSEVMKISLSLQGTLDRPIELVPGKISVMTYTSENMAELEKQVDEKTLVVFDEYHNNRNFEEKKKSGTKSSWAIIADQINRKAGRVVKATGTPIDNALHLSAYSREFFDGKGIDLDELMIRMGYEFTKIRGGREEAYRPISAATNVQLTTAQQDGFKKLRDEAFDKKDKKGNPAPDWAEIKRIDSIIGVDEKEADDRFKAFISKEANRGIISSAAMLLNGVKFKATEIPLDEDIQAVLRSVRGQYGGKTIDDANIGEALLTAQKFLLDNYKTPYIVKSALDAIDRGRKVVIWANFVNKSNVVPGEQPSAILLEEALLQARPGLKIAKVYGDNTSQKQNAIDRFNKEEADAVIVTSGSAGTGGNLDDKRGPKLGGKPVTAIFSGVPLKATEFIQNVYRHFRMDSASYPEILMITSQAGADVYAINSLKRSLGPLEAVIGFGAKEMISKEFPTEVVKPKVPIEERKPLTAKERSEKVKKAVAVKKTKEIAKTAPVRTIEKPVVAPLIQLKVASSDSPEAGYKPFGMTPEQTKYFEEFDSDMKKVFGKAYNEGVLKIKGKAGKESEYFITPTFNNSKPHHVPGSSDATDIINIDPSWVIETLKKRSPKTYLNDLEYVMTSEETPHVAVTRALRAAGYNPEMAYSYLGDNLGTGGGAIVSDVYFSNSTLKGKDLKLAKAAFASDSFKVGAEFARMVMNLQSTGKTTEQRMAKTPESKIKADKSVAKLIKELGVEPKRQLSFFIDQAISVFKDWPKSAISQADPEKTLEAIVSRLQRTKAELLTGAQVIAARLETKADASLQDLNLEFEENKEAFAQFEGRDDLTPDEQSEVKRLKRRQKELNKLIEDAEKKDEKKIEAPKKAKKLKIPESLQPFTKMTSQASVNMAISELDFRQVEKLLRDAKLPIVESEKANRQKLFDQIISYKTSTAYASLPPSGGELNFNRKSNFFDFHDLVLSRKIDMVLDGTATEFLRAPVEEDMYGKYVLANELYRGLVMSQASKEITPFENTLINESTSELADENTNAVYLDNLKTDINSLANTFAETQGEEKIPTSAYIPIDQPLPEQEDPRKPDIQAPEILRGNYTMTVGNITPDTIFASTPKHATSMFVFRTLAQRPITYNGKVYEQTEVAAKSLIKALGKEDPTYLKFAKRRPNYSELPDVEGENKEKMRQSSGGVNLLASMFSWFPNKEIKERLLQSLVYRQVSNDEQNEIAQNFIKKVGIVNATAQFLADSIPLDLSGRGAVGFNLIPFFSRMAKDGDMDAQLTLVDIKNKLQKNYATDPGRMVQYWRVGPDIAAESPQLFFNVLKGQLEEATKARLKPYIPNIQDTLNNVASADEIAGNAFASTPETQQVLADIERIRKETAAMKLDIANLDSQLANYINQESVSDLSDIFGDIVEVAELPPSNESEGDGLGFDEGMATKLSGMLLKVLRMTYDKSPDIIKKEKLRTVVMLSPFFSQAKNKEAVLRIFNHHFDAAYVKATTAFRGELQDIASALAEEQATKEAQLEGMKNVPAVRRKITPEPRGGYNEPRTRGEAKIEAKRIEREMDEEAPVEVDNSVDSLSGLVEASAKALQKQAEKIKNPVEKNAIKEFASKLRRMMAARTKEKGGLQPAEEAPVRPTPAQNLKELISNYPEADNFINDVRATLQDSYTPEQLEGLEPLIEEALGRPFTISNLSQVIRTLETIGGPNKPIQRLIRESRGDINKFKQELITVLTEGTALTPDNQQEVVNYLTSGLEEMIKQKREEALIKLREKYEKANEKKTRKFRTALDKLIENTNLGVLRDEQLYSQIHEKLGLPEIGPEERAKLEEMVNDLENYPKGTILNKKVEEINEYIKLLVPMSFGELMVSYQTANYLQGIGTLGINALSGMEGVIVEGWMAAFNSSMKRVFGGPEQKLQAQALNLGRQALKQAWWNKDRWYNPFEKGGPALARTAALEIWKYGAFPADSVVLKEMGGVNIFEAMLREAEATKLGKRGDKPAELVIRKPKAPKALAPITDFLGSLIPSFVTKPVESFAKFDENEIRLNLQAEWVPTTALGKAIAKVVPSKMIATPLALKELPVFGKLFGKLGTIADVPAYPFNSFLGPYLLASRLMATGDMMNKFGVKKMAEVIEAGYIIAKQNPNLPEEEFTERVNVVLNRTKDSIERAQKLAEIEAKQYGLTPDQQLLRVEEILDQNREQNEVTQQIQEAAKTRALRSTYQDDFYGVVGLIAGSLDAVTHTNWMPKLVLKFLRTSSNLVNEALNYAPLVSTWRLHRGVGRLLAESAPRYYRPPALPNTVEHDMLKAKMYTGYGGFALLGGLVAAALHDDKDNPWFFIHYKGPKDPQARKAYFQYGGKSRCIQIGKIGEPLKIGGVQISSTPIFIGWEALWPGATGFLLPLAVMAESARYDDRSTAEAVAMSAATAGLSVGIGFVDLTALQGLRNILSLIAPSSTSGNLLNDFATAAGGIAAGVTVPYYPTVRDIEGLYEGVLGKPKTRLYKDNMFSYFASSFPVVARFGDPDLDHLGGQISTQLLNSVPLVKRFVSYGLSTEAYDHSDNPSDQAVHDKLMNLFAKHGRVITWNAGDLKEAAQRELMVQAAQGIPIDKSPYQIIALRRDLTSDEKYEWIKEAGPLVQKALTPFIPALEAAKDSAEFDFILNKTGINTIKRVVLNNILESERQTALKPNFIE
jgi:hypothetical protein